MNLEKIYICAVIRRTEINYSENKNGHGWVQLGWTRCNSEKKKRLGENGDNVTLQKWGVLNL